jgi:hypothetical protein
MPPTGKSGANMLMSGESFGMNPLRSGGLKPSAGAGQRMVISDNFLEEDEDYEDDNTIRASRESGEIDPRFMK